VFEPAWKFISSHAVKNVSLEGFVEGDRKRELFSHARFVVVPSEWNEPFPTVVPEAYAHGKPVLASHAGGLMEMIESGRTGDFFTGGHPHALAEGLRRMFDQPQRMREWGLNGRRWVETHCDPAAWERSMRAILEEVLRGRSVA
jgi:glycosyltransferase involved in cell wall biosynthesis